MDWEPPAACINRIVKAALPEQVQVTKEAKSAFAKSAGIFILYLTTCANDFCKDKKRQTVSAADVMQAITELEFDEFKAQLQAFLASFRANEGSKRKASSSSKGKESAAPKAVDAAPAPNNEGDEEGAPPDDDAAAVVEQDDEEDDEPVVDDEDDDAPPDAAAAAAAA
ncbi:hypothetical protein CTAYLR_006572 [Chrysophaeum taylorii]|uniref:Transcription factor CBF/NF-Y/archaeal histone domain-containing protein n=1 Tax=Chrysophaeum taylorii TaxID=2483200 RepID=A0AAD7UMA1_9STRA|nr:hypothetical protein CTAYLR_006572 [Chrysophaeum taylorii]